MPFANENIDERKQRELLFDAILGDIVSKKDILTASQKVEIDEVFLGDFEYKFDPTPVVNNGGCKIAHLAVFEPVRTIIKNEGPEDLMIIGKLSERRNSLTLNVGQMIELGSVELQSIKFLSRGTLVSALFEGRFEEAGNGGPVDLSAL